MRSKNVSNSSPLNGIEHRHSSTSTMTSLSAFASFVFVLLGIQSKGAWSLLWSTAIHRALIPVTMPPHQPVIEFYVHEMPTSQGANQSESRVRCDVINASQDGVVLRPESNPFALDTDQRQIYTQKSLENVLAAGQANGEELTTPVQINVTTAARWQQRQCQRTGAQRASASCFPDDGPLTFDVYENTKVTLGRLAPLPYIDMCPGFNRLQKNYRIRIADAGYGDALDVGREDRLILRTELDREAVSQLRATVTCSVVSAADQSAINKVSRDIHVNVRDVNDCGPVIFTSSGIVKATERTLSTDKTDRLTFQDGDSDNTVNQYNIRVTGDLKDFLQYSQPTLISEKMKLYAFSLRVTSAPDRDLNGSVVIRDEGLVSRDPADSRAIYHVHVRGRRPPTSRPATTSQPETELPTHPGNRVAGEADTRHQADSTRSGDSLEEKDTFSSLDETTEARGAGHVIQNNSHVTGQMTRTGVSVPRELSISPDISTTYRVNISAAAARYTKVFEVKAAFSSFQIVEEGSAEDIPLSISPYSGVVYTTGSLRPYSGSVLTVHIQGQPILMSFNRDLSLKLVLYVHETTLAPTGDCERSCASARNQTACVSTCGYGSPSGRCVWRPAGGASHFSTCVPSVDTCPNEECDEDLENIVPLLCPQDCARTLSVNGHVLEVKGISSTTRGLCYCEDGTHCTCVPEPLRPGWPEDKYNGTYEFLPKQRCDAKCITIITISVGGALMLIVLLLTIFWWRHRLRKAGMKHVGSMVSISAIPSDYVDDHDRPSGTVPSVDWSPKHVDSHFESDPKWEVPRSNVHLEKVIGEGEFGRVVKARAINIQKQPGPVTVAVKMLKECASTSEFRDLLSEYNLLKDISHRNVIKLMGICSQKGPFLLIVEYCEHGSLRSYLRRSRHLGCYISRDVGNNDIIANNEAKKVCSAGDEDEARDEVVITAKDCLSFAWQTANGMSYLCDMKLVHRDLAARNLLVAAGKTIKISDFGLTRDIYEGDSYMKKSKGRIPVKWMAPESLFDQVYTTKSDVWSFGVVLWEIITLGATPYPGIPPERLYQLLRRGYRMDKPQGCSTELYCIMQHCWYEDPGRRPTFKYIASLFEDMLKANAVYLDLNYQADRQLLEDDTTDGLAESLATITSKDLKTNDNPNEPEYGSINILSTDNNSYVLTPSLQLNEELTFTYRPRDDHYSNWSSEGKQSLDGATEETHFLHHISAGDESGSDDEAQSNVGQIGREKKAVEVEGLVNENRV